MADPSNDQLTIYSNDMKSYGLRNGVARFLEHAARERARRLHGRPAGLRPHGGRRRRLRGRVLGERAEETRARAVDAARGNGVGHEGPAVRVQAERRVGRAGQAHGARVRRARRRLRALGLQRAGHGADRAAHGQAPRAHRPRRRRDAVGAVRDPESAHVVARRRAADGLGDAAAHRQLARPERAASDVRVRRLHRRARGGGQSRPRAVPPRDAREERRGQRVPQSALAGRRESGRREVRLGRAAVAESRKTPATSRRAAASRTRTAATRSSP